MTTPDKTTGDAHRLQPVKTSGRFFVWIGAVTAICYWRTESLLHTFVFEPLNFELIPADDDEIWMRTVICGLLIGFGAYAGRVVSRLRQYEQRLEAANKELAHTLEKALAGTLPICSWCKAIRTDRGEWVQLETYLHNHTEAEFTHGMCPTCEEKQLVEELNLPTPNSQMSPARLGDCH